MASVPPPPLDDDSEYAVNPYAAPKAKFAYGDPDFAGGESQAEVIRRAHLKHEAAVKSIGSLHYLAAILSAISLFVNILMFARGVPIGQPADVNGGVMLAYSLGVITFGAIIMAVHGALGFGLTKLQTWARWTEFALMLLGLLSCVLVAVSMALSDRAVPGLVVGGIFGLIFGYIIYLLVSQKGTVVFSPQYKQIIAQTPHVVYRSSCLSIIGIVLAVFVLLAVVGAILRVTRVNG